MAREQLGGASTAPVIRPTNQSDDETALDPRRLLPAWIISGVLHVLVLSFMLLVTVTGSGTTSASAEEYTTPIMTEQEAPLDANLELDDPGLNPDRGPINYDLKRLEKVSIPGVERPGEPLGIVHGVDMPAQTAPPLPGPFSQGGENGGVDSRVPGRNFLDGNPGGMRGPTFAQVALGRSAASRDRMLLTHGGNARSEAAVAAGLKWLVRHQAPDGRWSLHLFHTHGNCNCGNPGREHDVAATGLGLLPLLGAGQTHKGTGKNHLYSKNVEHGLKWLIGRQGGDGSFSGNGYEHAICTIALCEAYGLTGDPWLRGPAQRAVNRCVTWQRPQGGFRYAHPPAADQDLSVSGWFVQAAKSAQMAGLTVPNSTFAGIHQYLDSVSTPSGDALKYQETYNPSPAMTAVGLLCRQYLGWGPRNPALAKGVENLEKVPPGAIKNIYYYYYATQVVHHFGGPAWEAWNPRMRDLLIDTQDKGLDPQRPDQKGSWSPAGDAWGGPLGRLGYTALALLTLEVYYRHLPLYHRELAQMKPEALRGE